MSFVANARKHPGKTAVILGDTGDSITYGELNDRSLRFSQLLRVRGLSPGDTVALFMDSGLRFHEILFGALRSNLYVVPISKYATAEEAAYLVQDCDAKCVVVSARLRDIAEQLRAQCPAGTVLLSVEGPVDGYDGYENAVAGLPAEPTAEVEILGDWMLYSSGTTGRPLGIRRPLRHEPFDGPLQVDESGAQLYGLDDQSVFYTPAPLYHSAPLCYTSATLSLGGTVVISAKFDARRSLELIERYRVTTGQWVPSMFVRMLKLPREVRDKLDVSSQRLAVHGAGPCSRDTKQAMIDWWGPILVEYFGSTEFTGLTRCDSQEWLAHPGTVGRAILGTPHVCDESGRELAVGETGLIYFERDEIPFAYHKNPGRTEETIHPVHRTWTQVGDMGYLDTDGYIYLVDRASFMIISGGVNIYPREIEDVLIGHPAVADVAVFGVPNEEMGEEVKAVVQTAPGIAGGDSLSRELMELARTRLAAYKCPRSIDYIDAMPRQDTGKLYKRILRDAYLAAGSARLP
ncbi:acyl-CoA synthetase [Amycolatopsis sp. GM8]|uniref:acyl-CoA synthetase n=1 Tax=Amycolatopsis sp. GM8 TaxID=2896530 RepID=UPI001F492720|nr:acyl-CoA synthetase [Amycolatopsis sp. GM8]